MNRTEGALYGCHCAKFIVERTFIADKLPLHEQSAFFVENVIRFVRHIHTIRHPSALALTLTHTQNELKMSKIFISL